MKTGLLLINLGTPDAPSVEAVRAYLDEFLMDPYVIDLPYLLRYALVKGIILRSRPQASAKLYQSVWMDDGSPLLVLSRQLTATLQKTLPPNHVVELGMRYANPSINEALKKLMAHSLDELIVLPLFPQYSEAATLSAINAFNRALRSYTTVPRIRIISSFYDHPAFIEAYAAVIRQHLDTTHHDHLLMSYHGLPVRHLEKTSCQLTKTHCKGDSPCPAINTQNKNCYRAQCFTTTRLLAEKLELNPREYSLSFQSRLGKTPWIKPYTDFHLPALYEKGIRRLAIVCPSFVTDCLETLEEIAIRAKQQWLELGGESLTAIPCLNTSDDWIQAIIKIYAEKHTQK